mgnify:CR=1 FL=1
MAKEWLDIVDTTVKIGLGAFISGATTFYVTRAGNKFSELKESREYEKQLLKEKRERKARIAEQSLENIEPYLVDFSEYIATIDGILKSGKGFNDQGSIDFLYACDKKIVDSRAKLDMCEFKLKFIGFIKTSEKLNNISQLENELREKVIFGNVPITDEDLNDYRSSFVDFKKSFLNTLNLEYEELFIDCKLYI